MPTVIHSISLVAVSITVNTHHPSSQLSYYMHHTQTHYNISACYTIISTHAWNIWSGAAIKTLYSSLDLTEDYGYSSARPWVHKYNTTTDAIHTLLAVFSGATTEHIPAAALHVLLVEVHITLVTSRSHGLSDTVIRQILVPWNKETLLQLSM